VHDDVPETLRWGGSRAVLLGYADEFTPGARQFTRTGRSERAKNRRMSLPQPRVLVLRLTAALATSLLAVLVAVAVHTRVGQETDVALFSLMVRASPEVHTVAAVLRPGVPAGLAVLALGLGAAALARRRPRRAFLCAALVLGAVLCTWALRNTVIDRAILYPGGSGRNSLPSAHATAAFALSVAVVVLWPARLRTAGVAALLALATSGAVASVVTWAHRPSDVVASGLLVAALAALLHPATWRRRRPRADEASVGGRPRAPGP